MSDKKEVVSELGETVGELKKAVNHLTEKTRFELEEDDYAVILRSDGTMEQFLPKSVEEEFMVKNDLQYFFLLCCLLYTTPEDQDPEPAKMVSAIFDYYSEEDEDLDEESATDEASS